MAAIETRGLTKAYAADVVAVDDLDLTVDRGEIFGFLGPNGAGKSTTIDLLVGFLHPSAGTARVLGRDVQSESLAIREHIGILPEGAQPYDRLTGHEHVSFAMDCKGVNGTPDGLLERVGLTPAEAKRRAGTYSRGMTQRLGLAMALVGEPELLILDEPSTGLDPGGMADLREIIREEAATGTAVFFSSHLLGEVETVCDRVGMLFDGTLVADDTIESLRDRTGGRYELTLRLDPVPDIDPLRSIDGVTSASVDGDTLTVGCRTATGKAEVVSQCEKQATILDIDTEERSLGSLFEAVTDSEGEQG